MKEVKLRMKENMKYEVIKELVDHNGNKKRAAEKLNLSLRQINRLILVYKEKGKSGFVHGNRSRKPVKTLDLSFSNNIILLYTNKYQDFNFCHFKDYLEEKENIYVSYSFIYNTLTKNGIYSPRIRKATNTIVGGYFDKQETLKGYYNVLHQILINYGIPFSFTTDNRTVFNYMSLNRDKRTAEKDVLTQFGYACKQLGIDLKTTSVSQAKGLIERDNGTFQGRLINELKLEGINSIDKANDYLINVFIPKFNNKFAIDYKKFDSVFEVSPSLDKINYILAVLSPRKIDNGNSIKYKHKYYQPYLNGELKCFLPKTEVLVINAFNGDLLVTIDEKVYQLKELIRNQKVSPNIDINEEIISKEKKKYIPPMSHPWKLASFKKQMKKAHTNHVYT